MREHRDEDKMARKCRRSYSKKEKKQSTEKAGKDWETFSITKTKEPDKHFSKGRKEQRPYCRERVVPPIFFPGWGVVFGGRIWWSLLADIYSTESCKIYFWNLELESWM